MNKENILDVLFFARNTQIGKLKERDKEFLELIESSFDVDSEFPTLNEEIKKQIKEYVSKIQNKVGIILSQYDIKYYKSRLVRLC